MSSESENNDKEPSLTLQIKDFAKASTEPNITFSDESEDEQEDIDDVTDQQMMIPKVVPTKCDNAAAHAKPNLRDSQQLRQLDELKQKLLLLTPEKLQELADVLRNKQLKESNIFPLQHKDVQIEKEAEVTTGSIVPLTVEKRGKSLHMSGGRVTVAEEKITEPCRDFESLPSVLPPQSTKKYRKVDSEERKGWRKRSRQESKQELSTSVNPKFKEKSSRCHDPLPGLPQFLRNLLDEPFHNPRTVSWEERSAGVFRITNLEYFYQSWREKMALPISYELLKKSIKNSQEEERLIKIPKTRNVYKFVRNPQKIEEEEPLGTFQCRLLLPVDKMEKAVLKIDSEHSFMIDREVFRNLRCEKEI